MVLVLSSDKLLGSSSSRSNHMHQEADLQSTDAYLNLRNECNHVAWPISVNVCYAWATSV